MSAETQSHPLPPHIVTLLPKVLMSILIGSVTLWFIATPYLVRPHKQFSKDM